MPLRINRMEVRGGGLMDIKNVAIGSLTIVILTMAGFMIAPDSNYFCRATSKDAHCDRISSTGKTCYPYKSNSTGSKSCASGWEKIKPGQDYEGKVRVQANGQIYDCPGGEVNSYTICRGRSSGQAYMGELI